MTMKTYLLILCASLLACAAPAQIPTPEAPADSPRAASPAELAGVGSASPDPTAFIPALPPEAARPSTEEARAAVTLGNILANGDLVLPITGTVTIPSNSLAVVNLTIITNNLTIVTNVNVTIQYVTNVFPKVYVLTSPPAGTLTPLFGNVIDPALGRRLVKTITGATGLTIGSFNDTNWATVYLVNPNRYPVTWPPTNQVNYRGGSPPDPADPFPIVYFESVYGRIIATQ